MVSNLFKDRDKKGWTQEGQGQRHKGDKEEEGEEEELFNVRSPEDMVGKITKGKYLASGKELGAGMVRRKIYTIPLWRPGLSIWTYAWGTISSLQIYFIAIKTDYETYALHEVVSRQRHYWTIVDKAFHSRFLEHFHMAWYVMSVY